MRSVTSLVSPAARILLALSATGAFLAPPLGAQERSGVPFRLQAAPGERASLSVQAEEGGKRGGALGYAKWGTLAVSAGASLYGFHLNSLADDRFAEIEGICAVAPARCRGRNPDGSFSDDELEALYQEVLDKDRSARAALILAQVGLATTIVLFIMDLGNGETPPDIPFEPPRISVSPTRAEISYSLALPFH